MSSESFLRIGFFLGILVLMALLEAAWPRRPRALPRSARWTGNLGLAAAATLLPHLILPVFPVGLAMVCQDRGLGLLNGLPLPGWLSFLAAVLALDLAIYLQHRAFHSWRPLWLLHRVHHADTEIDTTTGIRFHPLEILLSFVYKLALVPVLGPSPQAVVAFEILLNACSLFNHANLDLPLPVDRVLRLVLVTPDMHRVHHSTDMREANRNFAFCLAWWDRLLATYTAQPAAGHLAMPIGLNLFRGPENLRLVRLLILPFARGK